MTLPDTIPAIIGHANDDTHTITPYAVTSVTEYEQAFGTNGPLTSHINLYYANGGGRCIILNTGNAGDSETHLNALLAIENVTEITLLVNPGLSSQAHQTYQTVVRAMLRHCAQQQNRFAIIDVYNGAVQPQNAVPEHRIDIGNDNLQYGASYYPHLETQWGTLPPSCAVAGVYSRVDNTKGIWKAPANEALQSVSKPAVSVTNEQQQNINVDPREGKSINVIREFPVKGTLVWGARTLAGNDNEWRYVPVRRYMSAVSQVIAKTFATFKNAPNEPSTWKEVQLAVWNFLYDHWKRGALAGIKPEQAFYVAIGLGQTMTQQDIVNGIMVLETGIAMMRPAEFITLRFQQ